MYRAIVLASVVVVSVLACQALAADRGKVEWKQVYVSDFAKEPGKEWSSNSVTAADGKRVLGLFANDSVTLSQSGLPAHRWVRVQIELRVAGSWDGAPGEWGPDEWFLVADEKVKLIRTSFDHAKHRKQAYPDSMPLIIHKAGSDAAEEKNADSAEEYRAVYKIEAVFPHASDKLKLTLGGEGLEGVEAENWGVQKIEVQVANAAAVSDSSTAALNKAWTDLGSSDAKTANRALWDLVGAGLPAIEMLSAKLPTAPSIKDNVTETPKADALREVRGLRALTIAKQ